MALALLQFSRAYLRVGLLFTLQNFAETCKFRNPRDSRSTKTLLREENPVEAENGVNPGRGRRGRACRNPAEQDLAAEHVTFSRSHRKVSICVPPILEIFNAYQVLSPLTFRLRSIPEENTLVPLSALLAEDRTVP